MNRVQPPTERIVEYATDLFELAEESYPEIPSEQIDFLLRDRFISGVLPEFIQFCDFEQCTTFNAAFDCARKREERVLSAQAAQKFQRQRPLKINSVAEQTEDKQPTNFSLGITAEIDAYRQEMRSSQKELLDVVHATIEGAGNSENTGQHGSDSNRFQRTFRWTEDGSPVCSYCSKVGHKYRNCHRRQRDEASANGRGVQSEQGSRPVSPQSTIVPTPTDALTLRQEAWMAQNAVGAPSSVDPYFPVTQVTPQYVPTFQQMCTQLNALQDEVRDLRLASLCNQVNSVVVSEVELDDTTITLVSPDETTFDYTEEGTCQPPKIIAARDEGIMTIPVDSTLEEKPGEEETVGLPVMLSHSEYPESKPSGVTVGKPGI
ncbi:MAG: hypothetical protein GY696_10265, partial [Gammaproteobacteria bacterium]|nr:hypothetical protein [Gammaproteobacteria bacterium]